MEAGTGHLSYVQGQLVADQEEEEGGGEDVVRMAGEVMQLFEKLVQLEPAVDGLRQSLPPRSRPSDLSFAFPMFMEPSLKTFMLKSTSVRERLECLLVCLVNVVDQLEMRNRNVDDDGSSDEDNSVDLHAAEVEGAEEVAGVDEAEDDLVAAAAHDAYDASTDEEGMEN